MQMVQLALQLVQAVPGAREAADAVVHRAELQLLQRVRLQQPLHVYQVATDVFRLELRLELWGCWSMCVKC